MKKYYYILLVLFFVSDVFPQNGVINSYYSNKKLRESISFINNILDGTSYWFYENGNLKEERTYSAGKLNGWIKYYYDSGLLKQEIFIRDGVRDGLMRSYYDNGALQSVCTYEAGKLNKMIELDFDSLYVPSIDQYVGNKQKELKRNRDLFLCEIETCAKPAGGMEEIIKNLVYPEYAKIYGLEGRVSLIVSVDLKGNVGEVRVVKGLGLGCDEAAVEAVKKTKFLPGAENSSAVDSKVIFNVEFKLDDKDKPIALLPNQQLTEENSELRKYIEPELESDKKNINELKTSTGNKPGDKSNKEISSQNFICDVDVCPKPLGGLTAIMDQLILPKRVQRLKLNGQVVIEADIDMYGLARDTKVISGIGYGADSAAEVAVLSTQFEPGMLNGEHVRSKVRIIVPIITAEK